MIRRDNAFPICISPLREQKTGILSLEETLANLEKEMLVDAFKNTRGNVTTAAQLLNQNFRKFVHRFEPEKLHTT